MLFGLLTLILIVVLFNLYSIYTAYIEYNYKRSSVSCMPSWEQTRRTFAFSLAKTPRQVIFILLRGGGDANHDSDNARTKNQLIISIAGLSEKDHFS